MCKLSPASLTPTKENSTLPGGVGWECLEARCRLNVEPLEPEEPGGAVPEVDSTPWLIPRPLPTSEWPLLCPELWLEL